MIVKTKPFLKLSFLVPTSQVCIMVAPDLFTINGIDTNSDNKYCPAQYVLREIGEAIISDKISNDIEKFIMETLPTMSKQKYKLISLY